VIALRDRGTAVISASVGTPSQPLTYHWSVSSPRIQYADWPGAEEPVHE